MATGTDIISFDPALHDASREPDAQQILDLVLHQQLGTFSAFEISRVAELLPGWISCNSIVLANARADDARDWYFPVYTRKGIQTNSRSTRSTGASSSSSSSSSSWFGIHHLAEDQASANVHPLPPLPALPPSWRILTIVASAGGLLLLMPPIYAIPLDSNGDYAPAAGRHHPCGTCGNAGSVPHVRGCWMNSNEWGRTKSRLRYAESRVPQEWKPLLVCNPLTQTWRELPAPPAPAENSNSNSDPSESSSSSSRWRYDKVLIDVMVHDESKKANSYTIVMTFLSSIRMCVYTSTTNTWELHYYSRPLTARSHGIPIEWKSHIHANAVVRGRLHYAFLVYKLDDPSLATLRVFQIQVETGEWIPWREYALRVWTWRVFAAGFFAIARRDRDSSEALRCFALLECMGEMFAVIPTRKDEILYSNANINNNNNVGIHLARAWAEVYHAGLAGAAMPVHFHILGLNWDQSNKLDMHGVLQIRLPEDTTDIGLRTKSLLEKTTSMMDPPLWNWFSCTARGSVIWVTCEDYLLQYNVISGQSRTQIVRKPRLADTGVSYRPSFHMKP